MRRLRGTAAALAVAGVLLVVPAAPASSDPDPTAPVTATGPPCPTPSPTPGPAPSPAPTTSPSPSPGSDPCALGQGNLAESTRAVIAAQAALEAAQADLAAAKEVLAAARAEAVQAKAAERKARLALQQAIAAEQKTEREIARIRREIASTKESIGELARAAYRGGPLLTVQVVLEAGNPADFADRVNLYQSVLRAEGSALAEMDVASADLVNREARLQALRQLKQRLKAEADRQLARAEAAQDRAAATELAMAQLVKDRAEALAAAERARQEDIKRYRLLIKTSGALASRIVSISNQLQASGTAVQGTLQFTRPGTGEVTSPYGPRFHPILKYVKLHTGTDISAGDGYVYAADDGVVAIAESDRAYGNMTLIDHGLFGNEPVATFYAHQDAMLVRPGDKVRKGQVIGVVGSTGYSTGPHLHFEVRLSGEPTDPWPWIADAPLPASQP